MKWCWVLLFCVAFLAGCRNQAPTVDPFWGQTTIPPPPTGTACATPNSSYQSPPLYPPAGTYQPSAAAPGPSSYVGATQSPNLQTAPAGAVNVQNQPTPAPAQAGGVVSGAPAANPAATSAPGTVPGYTPNVSPAPATTPVMPNTAPAPATAPYGVPATPTPGTSTLQMSPLTTPYGTGRYYPLRQATPTAPATAPQYNNSLASAPVAANPSPATSAAATTAPTGTSINFRGVSLQGARPLNGSAEPPRPVDAGQYPAQSTAATATNNTLGGQQAVTRTLQPRTSAAAQQPVDMLSLPQASDGSGAAAGTNSSGNVAPMSWVSVDDNSSAENTGAATTAAAQDAGQ